MFGILRFESCCYQNISKKYLFTRSRFHENALNRSRGIAKYFFQGVRDKPKTPFYGEGVILQKQALVLEN